MGEDRDADHRYWAFISYSHVDRGWARWLHRRLERYRLPRHLIGRPHWSGATPRRLAPVFRDRDELPSSADLGGVIERALHQSRYLIVLCSANAAGSRWVNEEIETFKRLGREDRVLCLKIDGAAAAADCFPPALRERYDADGVPSGEAAEPLAADVGRDADGRDGAVLKLIAGMLGIGYDELRQRERRRRWRQRLLLACAAAMLSGLITLGWHWQQLERQAALDAQALQTRIARLYDAGRREALAHNEARAAVLLNEARRLGAQTPAIDFLLGRAMRAVDARRLRIESGAPVRFLHLDPQGRRLLSFGVDLKLRVFDARSGRMLYAMPVDDNLAIYVEFSATGKMIWIDTDNAEAPRRRLVLVDAESGEVLRRVAMLPSDDAVSILPLDAGDRQFVYIDPSAALVVETLGGASRRLAGHYTAVRFCGDDDSVLAARRDGVVEWRDAKTLRLHRQFDGLSGTPTMLYGNAACTLMAAGSSDGAVRVWQTADGTVSMSSGHRGAIIDLKLDAEGRRLLSVSRGHMGLWNPRGGSLLYSLENPSYFDNLVAMDLRGETLMRLAEGRLAALDPESGKERLTLDDHVGGPIVLGVGADGGVISAGADGSIAVWQLPADRVLDLGGKSAKDKPPQSLEGTPVAFSPDGRQFASGAGAAGELWQLEPLRRAHVLPGPPPQSLFYSGDGRRLASTAGDGSIRVIDTRSAAVIWERPPAVAPALVARLDRQGRRAAAVLADDMLQIWSVDDGATVLRQPFKARCGRSGVCRVFAFSPLDTRFASGTKGVVQMRDLDSGKMLWSTVLPVSGDDDRLLDTLAFSRDGRRLLVTAAKQHAFVLDASDGHIVHQLDEPASMAFSWAQFSPDGRQIAIADHGKMALIWDFSRGRLLHLRGHTTPVWTVSFSADGALLASGGLDGEIKIWDAASGDLLESFVAHDSGIFWGGLSFSQDRRYLLSGAGEDSVRLWAIGAETRSADTLAAELRCRTPWTVQGVALQPLRHDAGPCAPPPAPASGQEKAADAGVGGS